MEFHKFKQPERKQFNFEKLRNKLRNKGSLSKKQQVELLDELEIYRPDRFEITSINDVPVLGNNLSVLAPSGLYKAVINQNKHTTYIIERAEVTITGL